MVRKRGGARNKEANTKSLADTCSTNHVYATEIKKIISQIQKDTSSEQNFIQDMRRIYTEMDHNDFMKIIKSIIMCAMQQPEDNCNTDVVLRFICHFLATYKNDENINPCSSVFNFILSTDGCNSHIQFRLCQLVNTLLSSLGKEATLDDQICNQILKYMLNRLKKPSSNVRAEAIFALERLQVPDAPNDVVTKYFLYHMEADPSVKVRKAVISIIARNSNTIRFIIERLHDLNEDVRRHTYIEMMKGFPVKSLAISQRLTFLEKGLCDESKSIRKIVGHLIVTEWLISYNEDYILFLRSFKLNGTNDQLQGYLKTAKHVLSEIFRKTNTEKLLDTLAVYFKSHQDTNVEEFQFCIPIEKLTLEHSVFWLNFSNYIFEKKSNEFDKILPDLTTYCKYLSSYCNLTVNLELYMDDWQKLERGYIFTNLVSNLKYFDYSDEVGKNNLNDFICCTLKKYDVNDSSIQMLLYILESIVPDSSKRFPFLNSIIVDLPDNLEFVSDWPSIKSVLQDENYSDLSLTILQLKMNIRDLNEETANFLAERNYEKVEQTIEKLNSLKNAYNEAVAPLLKFLPEEEASSISLPLETISSSTILKCLKIIFYMVSSEKVSALTTTIRPLYDNFIRRYTESNSWNLRSWALKCGTSFAILYEQFSQDMFRQLHKQVLFNLCPQVWRVSIRAIFQLLVRYDLKHFDIVHWDKRSMSPTSESMCDNSHGDDDDNENNSSIVNVLCLMLHIMDTCTNARITNTVVEGFCLLCLHSDISYNDIISKLLIKYFDPATNSAGNQLLGVFFKALIARGKSNILQIILVPTIVDLLDAGYDSAVGENVIRFVTKVTSSKLIHDGLSIHELIAESFLNTIQEHLCTKRQLVSVLADGLVRLNLNVHCNIKLSLLETINAVIPKFNGEIKIKKNLIAFKRLLNGELQPKRNTETSIEFDESTSKTKNDYLSQDDVDSYDFVEGRSHHSHTTQESTTSQDVTPKVQKIGHKITLRRSLNITRPPIGTNNNSIIHTSQEKSLLTTASAGQFRRSVRIAESAKKNKKKELKNLPVSRRNIFQDDEPKPSTSSSCPNINVKQLNLQRSDSSHGILRNRDVNSPGCSSDARYMSKLRPLHDEEINSPKTMPNATMSVGRRNRSTSRMSTVVSTGSTTSKRNTLSKRIL